jgi:tetratricopeptide (TPR) repeat protein
VEKEPSPEFEEKCRAILRQWQAGELPFREAAQQFAALAQEAATQRRLANQARVEYLLGYMQGYRSNLSVSIKHFENARQLFERIGNEKRVMNCDLNLGETYRQKGDFTHARRLFRSAYENSIRLNEIGPQTIARANEGQMLLSMGQTESARAALLEALELTSRWPEDQQNSLSGLLCEIYHALAVINLNEGNFAEAWQQAKQALQIAREINQPLELGHACRTMGEVLTALEEPPEALDEGFSINPDDFFKASIDAFQSIDAEGEMARTLHIFARSLARRGRRVPAARKLQQATLIFAKLGMVDDAAKAAESQASIF